MISTSPCGVSPAIGLSAWQRDTRRDLPRLSHVDRPFAGFRHAIEHAFDLARIERAATAQLQQVTPCFRAHRGALLGAQDAQRVLARRALQFDRGHRGLREAAQHPGRGLQIVGAERLLIEPLAERLERQVVAAQIGLEPFRQAPQDARRALLGVLVVHVPLSTPWSMSM